MLEISIGKNVARLFWVGDSLVFDRIYDGHEDSKIRHVFDDRLDDPNRIHKISAHVIAKQVHWGCTGTSVNSQDLAWICGSIETLIAERPVRILPTHLSCNR
jgi:hypothetical protein